MTHKSPEFPDVPGSVLLQNDIPTELVDAILDNQRQTELGQRFSQQWLALQRRPNLRHFISVSSFEAAPGDPELRSKVTETLLGMLALLDEAKTTEDLEKQFLETI